MPTFAEHMHALGPEGQKKWLAVGQVQGPGYLRNRGCSGTLIAPKLVVTAAHCLTGALWKSDKQQFRAGLFRDSYAAKRTYEKVDLHPLFSMAKGKTRLPYDIAVLHLIDPIDADEVTPIPLVPAQTTRPAQATLLGYRQDQPNVLSGQTECHPLSPPLPELHLYDCQVVSGTSGGAVIVDTPEGPVLAAVIVARHGPEGQALAVPVNAWLREKLDKRWKTAPTDPDQHRVFNRICRECLRSVKRSVISMSTIDSTP